MTLRLAPFSLVVLALVDAVNVGLNASALQLATWKGLDAGLVTLNVEESTDSVCSSPQFVGLSRKLGRLTATLRFLSLSGTPPTIRGSVLVAITRELWGSTLIVARVVTRPRSNGPAAASTGIDRP